MAWSPDSVKDAPSPKSSVDLSFSESFLGHSPLKGVQATDYPFALADFASANVWNGKTSTAGAQESSEPKQPLTMLESGIDVVTKPFIKNGEIRYDVDHYSAQLLKGAALFTPGRTGHILTAAAFSLDQPVPQGTAGENFADIALGALRGVAVKSAFEFGGSNFRFAPTKGAAIGIMNRVTEDVLRRDSFENPELALRRLQSNVFDRSQLALDAAVWSLGEAAFGGINVATKGALAKSEVATGVATGGTFGVLSGASDELVKEDREHKAFSLKDVAREGAIGGLMGAAGARLGIAAGHLSFRRSLPVSSLRTESGGSVSGGDKPNGGSDKPLKEPVDYLATPPGPKPPAREFVITGGLDKFKAFQSNDASSAWIQARELHASFAAPDSPYGGSMRIDNVTQSIDTKVGHAPDVTNAYLSGLKGEDISIYLQRLNANDTILDTDAGKADLVATAYPENLSPEQRENHVFPAGEGKVWVLSDNNNRVVLTNDLQPSTLKKWNENGFVESTRLDGHQPALNLMAPLMVGDPKNLDSDTSKVAWNNFDAQLKRAKEAGATAISTDVWWGVIEPEKGKFDFSYIDKLAQHIEQAGLKWNPILSFHECGGNIGDTVNVSLPEWVWKELAEKMGSADAAKYKSEQGNVSTEYISLWADKHAMEMYGNVMDAFQNHYANKADLIAEINISLGPAGEMRYPSYNMHDKNTGYPTRGALQAYSEPAKEAFRQWALAKYGDLEGIKKTWNYNGKLEEIGPPSDAQQFFDRKDHINTQYGKDFFDWYSQELIDHGRRKMTLAQERLSMKGKPFAGKDLGAKVAGVHWMVGTKEGGNVVMGDRLAELAAGLIRTSGGDWQSDADGHGYKPIFTMFKDVQSKNDSNTLICPSFTCIELPDGDGGADKKALPNTLARWVGAEAERNELWLNGENALNFTLADMNSWGRIRAHFRLPDQPEGFYHGATFLRMGDVVDNPDARAKFSEIVTAVRSVSPSWWQNFTRIKKTPPTAPTDKQ